MPPSAEKPGQITEDQVAKFKAATYTPDYVDEAEDAEALGVMVSRYLKWDGAALIRAFSSALEDANFHSENAEIREKYKWAFE